MIYPPETRRRRSHYKRALKRRRIVIAVSVVGVFLLLGVFALSASLASRSQTSSRVAILAGDDLSDLSVGSGKPAADAGFSAGEVSKTAPKAGSAPEPGSAPEKDKKNGRLVYRYSVVPGGVRTPAELAEAVAHDPDVALHYSRLNFRRARLVRLLVDQKMYVSYRKGGRILWTKKPHLIRAGETVITDGKVTARTRCGNRLASKPKGITEADEPTQDQLNQPVAVAGEPMRPPVTSLEEPQLAPLVASGPTQGPFGEPIWRSPFVGGGGGSSCPIDPLTHHCKKKKHHHPPPPVPEPGTIVLVGSGLLLMTRRYWASQWQGLTS